ncbi:MAG TPA: ABC transporter substrate-binding protein [Oligoflexia bacterium]|nr:ABC transporter substrate-binding protein [Oligoflexia bacterium]HMP26711.1 ABC transporter substrate-binding protein [Oligoflexia bacterium]
MRKLIFNLLVAIYSISLLCLINLKKLEPLEAEEVKIISIAGLFGLTGLADSWGIAESRAFQIAVEDFMKQNPNFRVKSEIQDSSFSYSAATSAFHSLTSVKKFPVIIGPTWEIFAPIIPLCERLKIICLSQSYRGNEFKNGKLEYAFSGWFDDADYARTLAAEIKKQKLNKIAVFSAISPYYETLVKSFEESFHPFIPIVIYKFPLEELDFKSAILKTPREIDGIFFLLDEKGQIINFLKQWISMRADRPPLFTDDLILYAEPKITPSHFGFKRTFISKPSIDEKKFRFLNEKYTARYATKLNIPSAPVVYDLTMIALNCLKDSEKQVDIRDCIRSVNNYNGLSGEFSFNGGNAAIGRQIVVEKFE